MINGKVADVEKRRLFVQTSATGTTGGNVGTGASYSHSAYVKSYFTPDAVQMPEGLSLTVSCGASSWSVAYAGPGAPTSWSTGGSGYKSSLRADVVFEAVKVYATLYSKWRTVVSAVKVYIDGVLAQTFSGIDSTSDALGPSWLQIWGCFAKLGGSCSASRTGLPGTMPTAYDYWAQCEQTISGMWEDYVGGSWVAHPVALVADTPPTPGGTCPFGIGLGVVSGDLQNNLTISQKSYTRVKKEFFRTDTLTQCRTDYYGWDPVTEQEYFIKSCFGTLSSGNTIDWYRTTTETESRGGTVWCVPNLPRSIVRFNADFLELVQRLGLPKTVARRYKSCSTGGATSSATADDEIHQRHTAMLSTVGNDPHVIEAPLSAAVYAPMQESASKSKVYTFSRTSASGPVTCVVDPACRPSSYYRAASFVVYPPDLTQPDDSESASCTFPHTVDTASNNPYINCYLYHQEPIARYVNFWASPHWLYWPYWPQEKDPETDELGANDWPVDGSLVSTKDYWLHGRTQWIHNTALPPNEDAHVRNSLVSFCGWESGHGPFFKQFVHGSVETSWLGISRWITQDFDPPASLQYTSASSPLWMLTDCTASFGSSVSVTPNSGKTTVKLELSLGTWSGELAMYPHLADRLWLSWNTANVTQVRAFLVSATGTKQLVEKTPGDGFTTRNETYSIPRKADSKYAGSWAQDMGCGIVADEGADLKPQGVSASAMANPERSTAAFLLAGGEGWDRLEIEVDCTGAFSLEYPKFLATGSGWTVVPENGHWQDVFYPDGPGLRVGQLEWSYGNSLITPPAVKEFPWKFAVVDWLCTKRALGGADPHTGVTTELSNLYDGYEGQSVSNASSTCFAFLLPGSVLRAALVNTYSEVPPLPHYPRRARDSAWQETGTWGLRVYEWAQGKRYLANAGSTALDLTVGGTVWTAPSAVSVSGWTVTEHQHAVDNAESGAKVLAGTAEIASVRPWHGWFAVYGIVQEAGGDAANLHLPLGMYVRATASDGGVAVKSARWGDPTGGWWKVSTPISSAASRVCLVADGRDNSVLLLASDGASPVRLRSFDAGLTWISETAMTGVSYERGDESPLGFATILGLVEGTMTLKGQIRPPGSAAFGATFAVKTAAGADLVLAEPAFDLHYSRDGECLVLLCKASGEADFGEWLSWDHGRTFKKA